MDFEELYRLYFKDIYRFIVSLSKNESIAEEVTQETFYKALKSLNQFNGEKDIRAWLFTIAKNTYFSYFKKNKGAVYGEMPEFSSSDVCFVEKLVSEEQTFLVHQFLHNMKEPYKEVFTLRVFSELPFEKIGILFEKSSGWARVTFYRAKAQIVQYMEEIDDGKSQL